MAINGRLAIGLVADTHYWPSGSNHVTADGSLQLQGSSAMLLTTLIGQLEQADLDLVIHLGDLTCGGGTYEMPPELFVTAMGEVRNSFASLGRPVYALPGNHDSMPITGGWELFTRQWNLARGLGVTLDFPVARLVLLNTHGHTAEQVERAPEHDPVSGWVSVEEMARLEDALATSGERPVLLFSHQLLHPWSGRQDWFDFYGVENAEAVIQLLRRFGNTRAIFQGHAHRFDVQTVEFGTHSCTLVVLPALIEYPLAWVRLDVTPRTVRMRLQRLPLPELREASRVSGDNQTWRAGRPEWWDYTIALK